MLHDEDDNPPARFGPIDPIIWVAVVPWSIVAIMMTIAGMAMAGIPLALIVAGIVVLDSWCNRPMPGLERSASERRGSRYDDQPSDVRETVRRPSPQESRAGRPVPGANRPPQRTGAPGAGGRAPAPAAGDRTAAARTRAVPGDRPAANRTAAVARDRAAAPARPGAAARQVPPPQQPPQQPQQRPGYGGQPPQQPPAPRRRPPGA